MPADIHSAKHPKRLSVESPSPLTRTRERKPRAAGSLGQGRGEQLLEAGLEAVGREVYEDTWLISGRTRVGLR